MRLRTQLGLAFLLLAVLPLAAVSLYSYASSRQAFRNAVEGEGRRLAAELSSRLEQAVDELSAHMDRMRQRARRPGSGVYEQARQQALAAAQQAELRSLLNLVLSEARRQQGSVPFAIDEEGRLYAADPSDLPRLYGLGLALAPPGAAAIPADRENWLVLSQRHAASGITVGVAHPLGDALREIRLTAVRNLGYGLGLVAVALLGILPLSRRLTRHLASLTEGAERLGRGELDLRVPVPRSAELGRLAETFNRMAEDLRCHQERLLEQERLRKELEISRRIQEELLPRGPARFAFAEVAGLSIPAREVGGDFFNYFPVSAVEAAVLVGDVSGKGVPAAILMANLQALLSARLLLERDLARLCEGLDRELGNSEPAQSYLTLFVAILDGARGELRYVNAGQGMQLLVRHRGGIEPLESTGRPLGLYPGGGYEQRCVRVERGDALVLFTDGLVEAENESGEPYGTERLESLLAGRDWDGAVRLLARVESALRGHRGANDASDDATIVALRLFESGS